VENIMTTSSPPNASPKRVRGVRAVADDIQVRLRLTRTDPEIC
jgi:hypothetical protein